MSSSTPTEIDQTLSRLSSYKNVRGVLVLTRQGSILRQSGQAFEEDSNSNTNSNNANGKDVEGKDGKDGKGKVYARAVRDMVEAVAKGVEDCEDGDVLRFMRLRTKKHEIIITPDEKYLLVVLQDPS